MSRLVNFGLGEICDRLSILALKILHGEAKGVDVAHFRNERAALMVKVLVNDGGRWIEYFTDLCAINAALWHAEDELRAYRATRHTRDARDEAMVDCAFRIQEWNDKRAELIQQINAFVGEKQVEKV